MLDIDFVGHVEPPYGPNDALVRGALPRPDDWTIVRPERSGTDARGPSMSFLAASICTEVASAFYFVIVTSSQSETAFLAALFFA